MKKNKLYWITDRTPHESLPMESQTYRQFFRLVQKMLEYGMKNIQQKILMVLFPIQILHV